MTTNLVTPNQERTTNMTNTENKRVVTIRNSVPRGLVEKIPAMIEEAVSWMQKRYASVDFSTTEFIFSGTYRRSRYFRNEVECGKYLAPNTCISTRARLYLYDKKSLNIAPKATRGMKVGNEIQMMCALVHELTHHAQYELNTPKGELETTKNELDYLQEAHPDTYKRCIKQKRKTYLDRLLEKHLGN